MTRACDQSVGTALWSKYCWIKAFITNIVPRLSQLTEPPLKPVISGVPQGSILGPVLFLLYINDISNNIQSSLRLFADDCVLYRVIDNHQDYQILQNDLDCLSSWADCWQLKFNVSKCYHLGITPRRHNWGKIGRKLAMFIDTENRYTHACTSVSRLILSLHIP